MTLFFLFKLYTKKGFTGTEKGFIKNFAKHFWQKIDMVFNFSASRSVIPKQVLFPLFSDNRSKETERTFFFRGISMIRARNIYFLG